MVREEDNLEASRTAAPMPEKEKGKKERKQSIKIGSRAPVACVKCRKRKIRCSGEFPSCGFCVKKGVCEFMLCFDVSELIFHAGLPCDYEGNHPATNAPPQTSTVVGSSTSPFSPTASTSRRPAQPAFIGLALPSVEILLAAYDAFSQNFEGKRVLASLELD